MRSLFTLLLLAPLLSTAQRLEVNQKDKFTGDHRVQTSIATLKTAPTNGLAAYFRGVGDTYYLHLSGYGQGVGVVSEGARAILLLDDGSTVTAYSPSIQSYEVGYQNTFSQQYRITRDDVQTLSQHDVKSVRRYTTEGYVDTELPRRTQGEIKKLAAVFLRALD